MRQLNDVIGFGNLPDIDNYLTNRKWTFSESVPSDSVDKTYYNHYDLNGNMDSQLAVYYCNSANNTFCSEPSSHENTTAQHCYLLLYAVKKDVFDKLKIEMKGIMSPTSSVVKNNALATNFETNGGIVKFIIDNSGPKPYYMVLCQTLIQDNK